MKQAKSFWLSFLGIRKEEIATVRMFFLHHFFLGLGQAMFFIAAISKFLEKLSPEYLAKVFVISSIVLIIIGRIYSHFEHHVPFKILLPRILLFLIGLTLTFRLAFYFIKNDIILALLEIAFFVVYLLSNLEFWGLSALVFDVRQGKRLFSLISSGDVPAKMLGYLSVSLFLPETKENLLIIAAIAFIISYFILKNLLPKVILHESDNHEPNPHGEKSILLDFFGNRFIFNLAILSFLYYAVFLMIEFIFFCDVKGHMQENPNSSLTERELAHSLSRFLSVSYALIFILKLSYSGKLLNLIGVKRALLAMPLLLAGFSIFYLLYGSPNIENEGNIYFVGIMAMCAFVVKYSINDPTFLVLFQPLSARFRLMGHTVIKGFVQSLALGLTGLTLWACYEVFDKNTYFFYYLNYEIILLIFAWVLVVFVCYKTYIEVLNEAIKKRFITGTDLAFNDETYLKLLKQKLGSNVPEETMFSLATLNKLNPSVIKENIPTLLQNPHKGVLNKTIDAILNHKWFDFAPQLYNLIEKTTNTGIKSRAINAYCLIGNDAFEKLSPYFKKNNPAFDKALILGFINGGDLKARISAEQKLASLIASHNVEERILASEIIGELKDISLQKSLITLINDENEKVSIAAIFSAGQLKDLKLIPTLLERMKQLRFKKYVINSLGMFGKDATEAILNAEILGLKKGNVTDKSLTINEEYALTDIIKICEKTGGKNAEKFLIEQTQHNNITIRGAAIEALNILNYTPTKEVKENFNKLLEKEFIHANALLNASITPSVTRAMQECIHYEFDLCINRIFQIIKVLYDKDVIKKAEAAVQLAQKEKKANALEMLDNIIPKKVYDNISALLENMPNELKIEQLKKYTPSVEIEDFQSYVVQKGEKKFTDWTISVALRESEVTKDNFEDYVFYFKSKKLLLKQSSIEAISNFKNKNADIYDTIAGKNYDEIMKGHTEQRLTEIEKVFVLKSTQLFSETPENIIAEIVPIVKEVAASAGDIIFNKGDNGNSMYIIYEGAIKIHDGNQVFAENKSRDFFGELALLDPEPRSATATAITDTLLLKLDEEEWYELMEDRPEVLKSIMKILCRRIRHQNEQLKMLSIK